MDGEGAPDCPVVVGEGRLSRAVWEGLRDIKGRETHVSRDQQGDGSSPFHGDPSQCGFLAPGAISFNLHSPDPDLRC